MCRTTARSSIKPAALALSLAIVLTCGARAIADPVAPLMPPTAPPSTLPTKMPIVPDGIPAVLKLAKPKFPATVPADEPTTRPLATTAPATRPGTTRPLAKFPTPAELLAKIRKAGDEKKAMSQIAYFDLTAPLTERPPGFSIFRGEGTHTLHDLLDRLRMAKEDKEVRGVLITLGAAMKVNLAQAQEIRDTLIELRRAGKKTFVHAESFDTVAYTIASGATDVCMLAGGEIEIPGIGFETMFYKGTFDKIGVEADFVQIGEFKGADESYTRSAPSEELRGELNKLADSMFEEIVSGIALNRNLPQAQVKQMIDDTALTGQAAVERGFVDHLVDQDGLRDLMKDELGNEIDLVHDYGEVSRDAIDFSNPFALLTSLTKKEETSDSPAVAVIYAEGTIVDGDGEQGLFGDVGVGSESMRKAFRVAMRDPNVKAVVLRIDSPGGSALASEVMWQSARRLAKEKPLVVSVGSMAASGGYYLASAGDYIFADPVGIVGSIGVVGGKMVLKDVYEKLGLTTENFSRGRNADLYSSSIKWSDRQRRMVRSRMQTTYEQFIDRIKTTRDKKIGDIDKVARGRIFMARQAKELGMIDEIGGTEAAIAYAAKQAKLEPDEYDVKIIPAPKTLGDYLTGRASDEEAAMPFKPKVEMSMISPLSALPADVRAMIGQQLRFVTLLGERNVVLISPFAISTR